MDPLVHLNRIERTMLIVLSLLGGLGFSVPIMLLANDRDRRRGV